jgi:hypothetical protein
MQHGTVAGPRPVRRGLKLLGGAVTAAVMLSVPAFAVSSVASWGRGPAGPPEIAASDDAVANGFRIVRAPAVAEVAKAAPTAGDTGAETVLKDWTFTGKPLPSTGN